MFKDLPESLLKITPTYETMSRTVSRVRKTMTKYPLNPISLESLVIPEEFKYIEINDDFELFLQYDSFAEGDNSLERVLIFSIYLNYKLRLYYF